MKTIQIDSYHPLKPKENTLNHHDNDYLLNEMYSRAKYKSRQNTNQHSKYSTGKTHSIFANYIPNPNQIQSYSYHNSIQNTYDLNKQMYSRHYNSINEKNNIDKKLLKKAYIKTQMSMNEDDDLYGLQLENQVIKDQLTKCQSKIVELQSYQQESQYLKKLCLLQSIEIDKLRGIAKRAKMENAKLLNQNKSNMPVKHKNSFSPIFVDENENMPLDVLQRHQKLKCNHKNSKKTRQKDEYQNRAKITQNSNHYYEQKTKPRSTSTLNSHKVLKLKKQSKIHSKLYY